MFSDIFLLKQNDTNKQSANPVLFIVVPPNFANANTLCCVTIKNNLMPQMTWWTNGPRTNCFKKKWRPPCMIFKICNSRSWITVKKKKQTNKQNYKNKNTTILLSLRTHLIQQGLLCRHHHQTNENPQTKRRGTKTKKKNKCRSYIPMHRDMSVIKTMRSVI